jgi:hypothetical protein
MFEYYDLSKLEHLPEQQWIIKNVIPNNGFIIVYGEPGSGKSFFALDLGLRISNNIMYHQNIETLKSGICLYLFGEGVCGIKNRVKAWHKYYDIEPNSNFICVPMISNLKNEAECDQFISNCKTLEKKFGDNIALVIVDTLARSSLGIDENSAQEMGMIIHSFDKIKNELDTTVMIIHHSKKGGGGIRGSGSILGAVDTSMKVTKKKDSDIVTIETEKQKDGPDFNMTFKLEDSLESKVIVSTETGTIVENELKVDKAGQKWDEEQYILLLELVKCKDVYEIATEFQRSVSAIKSALKRVFQKNNHYNLPKDELKRIYNIKFQNVIPNLYAK